MKSRSLQACGTFCHLLACPRTGVVPITSMQLLHLTLTGLHVRLIEHCSWEGGTIAEAGIFEAKLEEGSNWFSRWCAHP